MYGSGATVACARRCSSIALQVAFARFLISAQTKVNTVQTLTETHVEQKITRLELHEKLGYKASEVWEIKNILSGAQTLTIGSTTGWNTRGTLGYAQCAEIRPAPNISVGSM